MSYQTTMHIKPNKQVKLPNRMSMSYGEVETIETQYEMSTRIITDLVFSKNEPNNDLPDIEISNSVFLVDLIEYKGYFHLVMDILAEYEALKSMNPDLELLFVITNKIRKQTDNIDRMEALGLFSAYGIDKSDVVILEDLNSLKVKKAMFLSTHFCWFLRLLSNYGHDYKGLVELQSTAKKEIQKKFLGVRQKSNLKKIFITRKIENENRRRTTGELANKIFYGLPLDSHEALSIRLNNFQGIIAEVVNRTPSRSDEEKIEKFFESHGYAIVNPGGLDMFDQAELYHGATHVAGLSGTGMVNTIFCKDHTKVIIIETSDLYEFPHADVVNAFNNVAISIPKVDRKRGNIFSAKDIIDLINRKYLNEL